MSNQEKRIERENKDLRRQVEILKAQLKSSGTNYITEANSQTIGSIENSLQEKDLHTKQKIKQIEFYENTKHVRKDLLRTLTISSIIFAVILGLFFSNKF